MRFAAAAGLVAAMVSLGSARADAATISFQSLSQVGTGVVVQPGPFTLDGFTFSSPMSGMGIFRDSDSNHPVGGSAATALFQLNGLQPITMTMATLDPFDVFSLDVAPLVGNMGGASFNMTVVGTRDDLSTVSQVLNVLNGPTPVLQTFALTGFTDLASLTLTQGALGLQNAYQFTNIVVEESLSAVPEPTSMLLVASGVGAFLLRRRAVRRR